MLGGTWQTKPGGKVDGGEFVTSVTRLHDVTWKVTPCPTTAANKLRGIDYLVGMDKDGVAGPAPGKGKGSTGSKGQLAIIPRGATGPITSLETIGAAGEFVPVLRGAEPPYAFFMPWPEDDAKGLRVRLTSSTGQVVEDEIDVVCDKNIEKCSAWSQCYEVSIILRSEPKPAWT